MLCLRTDSNKNIRLAMNSIMLVSLLFVGISMLVSYRLRSKFAAYSKIPLSSGLSGKEVAERMLRDNGIYDVKVLLSEGFLSDHYNPMDRTVNLSPDADPMGVVGRRIADQCLPAIVVGGHSFIRFNHSVLRGDVAGRV